MTYPINRGPGAYLGGMPQDLMPGQIQLPQPLPNSSVLLPGQTPQLPFRTFPPPLGGPIAKVPVEQQAVEQALAPQRPKPSGAMRRERPMFNRNAPGMPNGGYGQYQPKAAQSQWGF